jgi:hypothetical protein
MPHFVTNLGELETAAGRLEDAADWLSRSLEVQQRGDERTDLPRTLECVATLEATRGQLDLSIRLAGARESAYQEPAASRTPAG